MNRFAVVVLVAGCSSPPDVLEARSIPEVLQPDVAAVVTSNNQFACDIYKQLGLNSTNMVFSAFSMSTAFAMLDAGARTVSDAEIRNTFHWTLDGDCLHAAYGALLTSLDVDVGAPLVGGGVVEYPVVVDASQAHAGGRSGFSS